jgi:AraC-like DNA-binding protein
MRPSDPSNAVPSEPSIVQGAFGRATVNALARALVPHVHSQFNLLAHLAGPDALFECDGAVHPLTPGCVAIFNPWQVHRKLPNEGESTLFLALLIEPAWLEKVGHERPPPVVFPRVIVAMTEEQRTLCARLARALADSVVLDDATLEAAVSAFLQSLVRTHAGSPEERAGSGRVVDARIRRAIQYMRLHAHENPSMEAISAEAGMSRSRFFEQFKLCVGSSPQQYLDLERVMLATRMLTETDMPLGDIAAELTFSEPTHFARFFTQHMGMPPGEFRKRTSVLSKS